MNRSRSTAGSVASGAAALLQKARGHMRGQSFGLESKSSSLTSQRQQTQAKKDDEEDDVAAYLSQLSKKTSGMKKSYSMAADDIISDMSDLSLSDEKELAAPSQHGSSSQQFSKFMKKSSTSAASKSQTLLQSFQKSVAGAKSPASSIAKRPSSSFTSSALQKASKLNAKITARKKGIPAALDSDESDEESTRALSKQKPGVGARSDANADFGSDDAPEIGGGGSRFLKKSVSKGPAASTAATATAKPVSDIKSGGSDEESDGNYPVKGLHHARDSIGGTTTVGKPALTSTPSGGGKAGKQKKKKGGVYDRIMAQLDTDEEDMAELIGGVSQASSPEPAMNKKAATKRVSTPYKPAATLSDAPSDEVTISISPEPKVQAMTIDDLEPAALDLSSIHSEQYSSIVEEVSMGLAFTGLQTVDDLLQMDQTLSPSPSPCGRANDTPIASEERLQESYQDDFESVSERTVSPVGRPSPSPKPVLAEDTSSTISSVASSIPEVEEDKSVADSYTAEFSQASSSRHSTKSRSSAVSRSHSSSRSRSSHTWSRSHRTSTGSKSRSRSRTPDTTRSVSSIASDKSRSKSEGYSEDFDTVSQSTDADEKTITSDFSTSHSVSTHWTTSASSRSGRHRRRGRSRRKGGHDAAVQTSSSLHNMNNHWLKDYDFQTPGYFKLLSANLHDTVSHSVDPKVLETLTSFDPSALDYHASLMNQVKQTRLAVTNTLRQHQAFLESLEENYAYTTLEDTKLFIKRQKKRRRRREETAEAALQEVDMNVTSL